MRVYCIENTVNGKKYVGVTRNTIQNRFKKHVYDARYGSQTSLHRSIRKHGKRAFIITQIDEASSQEEMFQKERDWIIKLNTRECGYNLTDGGEGGPHNHSEETKMKISVANTGVSRGSGVPKTRKHRENIRMNHGRAIPRTIKYDDGREETYSSLRFLCESEGIPLVTAKWCLKNKQGRLKKHQATIR
jgi:group I intron endonuclease